LAIIIDASDQALDRSGRHPLVPRLLTPLE
jgi:hypothetical protein